MKKTVKMAKHVQVTILGKEMNLPVCQTEPEQSFPYLQANQIYQDLIKDVDHLKQYCLQRKTILETDFQISKKDIFEGLFQLGVSPGQKRLYPLGVLYYLFECPKQWGYRLGPTGRTYFCYQGSLKKEENVYEEFEKKQEQLKKAREEERRKKREQKLKEKLEQPIKLSTKKKKTRKRRKRKSRKLSLIKVLPRQAQFTLFLKHPSYLYLRQLMDTISKEERSEVSSSLKVFTKGHDLEGFAEWFDRRVRAEENSPNASESGIANSRGSPQANGGERPNGESRSNFENATLHGTFATKIRCSVVPRKRRRRNRQ